MKEGMVTCKRCRKPMGKTDRKCPHCGKGSMSLAGFVMLSMIGLIALIVADVALTNVKGYSVWKQFSLIDGSHGRLEDWIISQLNDPESYEHISTEHSEDGTGSIVVTTKFRAANAFGGKVVQTATGRYSYMGKQLEARFNLSPAEKRLLEYTQNAGKELQALEKELKAIYPDQAE